MLCLMRSIVPYCLQGEWVLLQNGHNAPHLLGSLESLMLEQPYVDPQFRCWITAEGSDVIPPRVLQTCIKITIDTPRVSCMGAVTLYNASFKCTKEKWSSW